MEEDVHMSMAQVNLLNQQLNLQQHTQVIQTDPAAIEEMIRARVAEALAAQAAQATVSIGQAQTQAQAAEFAARTHVGALQGSVQHRVEAIEANSRAAIGAAQQQALAAQQRV